MGEELVTDEKILEYIEWCKRQKLSFKEKMNLFEDSHGLEIRKRLVYPYSDRISRTDIEYSPRGARRHSRCWRFYGLQDSNGFFGLPIAEPEDAFMCARLED